MNTQNRFLLLSLTLSFLLVALVMAGGAGLSEASPAGPGPSAQHVCRVAPRRRAGGHVALAQRLRDTLVEVPGAGW